MKTLRAVASISIAIVAALALLFAWMSSDNSSVQRTIDKSRAIEANFKQAAAFVERHTAREGSMPTPKEFKTWAEGFPSRPYTINGIVLDLPPYTSALTAKYGQPPKDGYILSYWRGEWEETYVSWTRQSSLVFDQSAYFMFGSSLAQATLGGAIAALMGFVAFKLWPRRPNAA
jgi:hypothetical protein